MMGFDGIFRDARMACLVGSLVGCLVGLACCVPPLVLPTGGQVACTSNAECPEGAACAVAQQRCVPAEGACVVGGDVVADGRGCALPGVPDAICVAGVCAAPRCGDGVATGAEACDLGDQNRDDVADACRLDCAVPHCGDLVIDSGESCDGSVGDSAICDRCMLQCVSGAANSNLDGADGCEAPTKSLGIQGFTAQIAIRGDRVFAMQVAGANRHRLVEFDATTGDALLAATVETDNDFIDELFVVDGALIAAGDKSLEVLDRTGTRVIHRPAGDFGVAACGQRAVVRSEESIVTFNTDGSDEVLLARPSLEDFPKLSVACAGNRVFWIQDNRVVQAPDDGAGCCTEPTEVIGSPDGFAGLVANGEGIVVVGGFSNGNLNVNILGVTLTSTTTLGLLPPTFANNRFNSPIAPIVVTDSAIFVHGFNFLVAGVFVMPKSGGTPTMLTTANPAGEIAVYGDTVFFVGPDSALRSLTIGAP